MICFEYAIMTFCMTSYCRKTFGWINSIFLFPSSSHSPLIPFFLFSHLFPLSLSLISASPLYLSTLCLLLSFLLSLPLSPLPPVSHSILPFSLLTASHFHTSLSLLPQTLSLSLYCVRLSLSLSSPLSVSMTNWRKKRNKLRGVSAKFADVACRAKVFDFRLRRYLSALTIMSVFISGSCWQVQAFFVLKEVGEKSETDWPVTVFGLASQPRALLRAEWKWACLARSLLYILRIRHLYSFPRELDMHITLH